MYEVIPLLVLWAFVSFVLLGITIGTILEEEDNYENR